MTEILIADDHAVFREGIKKILSESPELRVAGEASTGQEVLNKVSERNYAMVILDITLPDRNGLDILKELINRNPKIRVLMLSFHPEEQYAERSFRAGALGYITKESPPDELIEAIRKVAQGRKYISRTFAEKIVEDLGTDRTKPLHSMLSDREYQVMCMIASGKTVKEIADELSLSVQTIRTYRSRILDKMKLKTNAQIIYYAIKHELVQ